MLNFEEELKKFKPSLEVEDIENAVYQKKLYWKFSMTLAKSYLPKAQMSPSPSQMHTSGLPKILIYIPARQPFYKMELPLILPEPLSESVPFPGEKMDFL